MREGKSIKELRVQLAKRGCPAERARKILRETAEHLEDLQRNARDQGLTESEAEARAAEQLGEPKELAVKHMLAMRRRTRFGRKARFYCLVFLPLIVGPVFWLEIGLASVTLATLLGPPDPYLVNLTAGLLFYAGLVLSSVMWLALARHAAIPLKWTLVMFGMMSLAALVTAGSFNPREFPWFGWRAVAAPNHYWITLSLHMVPTWSSVNRAAIPFLTGVLAYFWDRRSTLQLLRESGPDCGQPAN